MQRKSLGRILGFSLAVFLGLSQLGDERLYARESETVMVRVTVTPALSISVSLATVPLNPVPAGGSVSSTTGVVVTNTGSGVNETLLLSLANPTGWSAGAVPGVETFVLNGAFDVDGTGITWDPSKQAILTTPVRADATRFAGDQTGASIPVAGARTLWFQLRAPTATRVTTQQEIAITITAELL